MYCIIRVCTCTSLNDSSTDAVFNPLPAPESYLAHSLVDLLKVVSPGFRRCWDALIKRRAARNPLESQPSPLPHFASVWLAPPTLLALSQHTPDLFRLADCMHPVQFTLRHWLCTQ